MTKAYHQDNYLTNGKPDGGVSYGPGYTISWQRGPTTKGRNGAFLVDILQVVQAQLHYYQNLEGFQCEENEAALSHIRKAQKLMELRRTRREVQGVLGTHTPEQTAPEGIL